MPFGYLFTTTLMALATAVTLAPLTHPRPLAMVSFRAGMVVGELPFLAFYYLLASTLLALGQDDLGTPVGMVAFGIAVAATVGLPVIVRQALRTRAVVEHALADALGGAAWHEAVDPALRTRLRRRPPYVRILLAPFLRRRFDVERVPNIGYGDAGKRNLLDVYRRRGHVGAGPVLIHLHGGWFTGGHKNSQSLPLIYRLASQGWVCISANYRLSPAARFPDHVIDAKKVIAWVREHGHEYGADPSMVFVAGSSAGAHLAAMAALTANDPAFQPGFDDVDTSVSAAICLGGYYGPLGRTELPSSPLAYVRSDAPPFFVAHGNHDTVVPVDGARGLVDRLRDASAAPVAYAELPGAQHAFDLFHSISFDAVVDGIEAFAAWVRSQPRAGHSSHRSEDA